MSNNAQNISVVVPVLNEIKQLPELHQHLGQFSFGQVIWVDGGSADGSWEWLQQNRLKQDSLVKSDAGRALQMNAGAAKASQSQLLFLHADTRLPMCAADEINKGLRASIWGRFNIQFSEPDRRMKVIAFFINWRSKLTKIATGDQALFVRKETFERLGGFVVQPLMEDIEFCKQIKQYGSSYASKAQVSTSARRWLEKGVMKTVFLMWRFRLQYFLGTSAESLAKQYQQIR